MGTKEDNMGEREGRRERTRKREGRRDNGYDRQSDAKIKVYINEMNAIGDLKIK